MSRVALLAPLSGWVLPLAQVCDEVFAGGLAGDGLAIDPVDGVLHAPCDGVVVLPGNAKHALSVRHASGVEVLMHVGIDTVALHGEGFELGVVDGQRVSAGDPLLRFDLDTIVRGAKSAVTPVLVTSGGAIMRRSTGRAVRVGDAIAEIEPAGVAPRATELANANRNEVAGISSLSRGFRIPFDHGLHARPAAQIVTALGGLDARVMLHANARQADARSPVAMMRLGVQLGDRIEAHASGTHARRALDALATLLAVDHGPDGAGATMPTEHAPPAFLEGIVAAPGLAIGRTVRLDAAEPEFDDAGRGEAREREALEAARQRVASVLATSRSDVAIAHRALLDDPELGGLADAALRAGKSAAAAWRHATRTTAEQFASLRDERMRERAADLRDLEAQVLRVLAGRDPVETRALPDDAVLVADELLPSQLAALDATRIAGIVMARGGPTSHVALLAAALGIPTLVAVGEGALAVREGSTLALDTARRRVDVDPPAVQLIAWRERIAARDARIAADLAACGHVAQTRDGTRIAVHANIGAVTEIPAALGKGAEGCGLLRTEFLFLERRDAPSEEEQFETYAAAARVFDGRVLTIRTLDVGGDKPLAYLPMPREENPALGVRGLRVGLREPALLRTQLRAILRAAAHGRVRVMLPMVNDLAELRAARELWLEAARDLGKRVLPPLGVMIETPASALLAPQLAREADFFSIGSNDLSQYVLAMDRGHAALANSLDALHPAVLRAISLVVEAGRSVSLCGGLASDAQAVPVLIGLGLRELSAVPSRIPEVKRRVRELDLAECQSLARRALDCEDAAQVRALAREVIAAAPVVA